MISHIYFRGNRVQEKDLKIVRCFSESETSESFNWRAWNGRSSWRISDWNEKFWQMFTKVKIRKTKIWGLEEFKMLFGVVQEKILNINKS